MRRLLAIALAVFAVAACRGVLGLGDPLAYETEAGAGPLGEQPVVTVDNAACGADLVTDEDHCGRCSHSCRGSRCERGRCVPFPVTSASSPVFAVFDGRVFAFSDGNIVRIQPTGERFLIADKAVVGAGTRAMLATAPHIVWSGDEGVRVCSATGCSADGPELLSVAKRTGPVARVDGIHPTFPYLWASFADATVEKYAGTAPLSADTRVEGAPCAASFATVPGGAYLGDAPGKRFWLYRPNEPGRLVGAADDICAIAAGTNNVLYTDTTTVWRAPINADGTLGPRVVFAAGVLAPKVLATDAEHVYWAASTQETAIVRSRLTGCEGPPEIVVDALPPIESLAVDGTFLYFGVLVNAKVGRLIYRVAK